MMTVQPSWSWVVVVVRPWASVALAVDRAVPPPWLEDETDTVDREPPPALDTLADAVPGEPRRTPCGGVSTRWPSAVRRITRQPSVSTSGPGEAPAGPEQPTAAAAAAA
jgi:hypothetical protein